ncbi:MAG: molybdopterin oxidoreductase family protein [Acidobacteria bacterium]|nr:molybdopterin oxidoreductase family protein [Acidobacteriota bacterium]MBI3657723.1 molybdopterin oxidoreductase family protein [Acidobacteriota bacterium]
MAVESASIKTIRGACPHDCPDTCALLVSVEAQPSGERAVKVVGNPHHPTTNGFLCKKVANYLERTYSQDRLLHPMRRIGQKGEGRFERISWDTALAEIVERFKAIGASPLGPQAILPYSYAGTMGLVQGQSMDRRFFHRLGASLLARTICSTAGGAGYKYTIGEKIGTDPENFHRARLIWIWGANPITSNVHIWPQILRAKKENGARIVVIDPFRSLTAERADQHVAPWPGTDAALALGIMHVIFREGLQDRDYLDKYTSGVEDLRRQVEPWTPERTAAETGVNASTITALALEYATTRPAAIRINYGLQRHAGGGMAVRTISGLPAIVGAWREAGGGILLSTSGAFPLNYDALERPDFIVGAPRTVNMVKLGEALTELDNPPIKALCVYNSNPAATAPDHAKVVQGLRRQDLFTVVLEHFQTDTADFADIVLPATTQLEHFDVVKPYGHYYLMCNNPAIPPLGESKPNSAIFRRLAARMGFNEPAFQQSDEEVAAAALQSDHPALRGVTLERLKAEGWVRLNLPTPFLPFAEGNFPTPSGRCEFVAPALEKLGLEPVATYIPPREAAHGVQGLAQRYPLALLSPPAHSFLNSSFANLPRFRRDEREPSIFIHPNDAGPRRIKDGTIVRVFNDRGELRLRALVSDRTRDGVAVAPSIWWRRFSPDGGNVNQLTSQALTDMGDGGTFYDVRVEIAALE